MARAHREGPAALCVIIAGARGRGTAASWLGAWLARAAPRAARGVMTVALVGDRQVRTLNRRFRGADRPTDVLSFPAGPPSLFERRRSAPPYLGDVVIATGVARRQAARFGHSARTEVRLLALHGLLHLLGYDHEVDDGRMARLERRLRRRAGLGDGVIERVDRPPARPGRR